MSVVRVSASKEEVESGGWGVDNLRRIVEGMHNDGLLVLEGLIDPEHMDRMNEFMVEDGLRIRSETKYLNFGTENVQQSPPLHKHELVYSDVFENSLLFDAVKHILGPEAKWDFISGNTALPRSTKKQPVHSDERCAYMQSTFYLIANIPLIDVGPETGVTQLWPATHRFRSDEYYHRHSEALPEFLDQQEKTNPPIQPVLKRGSIVLRDLTLWHCGMPNPSDQVRCMIALGFSAKWWKNECYFKVPDAETESRLINSAKQHGIVAKPMIISQNYHVEKDKHDFNLGETDGALKARASRQKEQEQMDRISIDQTA
ncbi:hypothetical protein TRICI_003835 [Trichomonascus ciferrii]|uniref:Phytanoyl-CoA dioxygenase n=1 Tax=Trichomonascus ciferrii TaxID=44093 RepID=A0A642V7U9_9ASCO|nr:hypothetical protein TRICI_003835 [Trichomonascus ciferrii]